MTSSEFYQESLSVQEADNRSSILSSERENEILLSLSDDIAKIRSREDLLSLIDNRIKVLFPFHHGGIGIIDKISGHYRAFLSDFPTQAPEFESYYKDGFPQNPLLEAIMASHYPLVFDLDELSKEINLPIYTRLNFEAGMKELIVVTLRNEDDCLGFFGFYSKIKNSFNDHHLRILQAISGQISIAVSNIIANEEILEKHHENSMLLSLAKDITSCRTYKDVQDIVLCKLTKYFLNNEVMICLNNNDNLTHKGYAHTLSQETTDHPDFARGAATTYFINDGIYNVIADSTEPVIFDMDELMRRNTKPFYVEFWHQLSIKEIIGFPLGINNESIGAVFAFPKEKNTFNTTALKLAQAVCSYIGVALANIRSYEKIQSQLEEIRGYKSRLERENQYLQEQIKTTYTYEEIIGSNSGLRNVFLLVSNVAPSDSTVLILGETGTGKELIAGAIHNSSPRKQKLMVKVNCAAMPSNLVESELFGHEKGSFTGAVERRIGKFELADKGTLFLDEIGEVSLELQAKLLRALQEKEIERIGGKAVIKTDVRVIAASNRNLQKEVKAGKFRSDLFYRLNVFPISLPPLRERKEDIPMLVSYYIEKFSRRFGKKVNSIAPKAIKELMLYDWPGNVRELEHIIERCVLMAAGDTITDVHLLQGEKESLETPEELQSQSLEEYERAYILSVLKKTNGKIRGEDGAAEILKIPPTTLHSKMKKLGIRKTIS